MTRTELEGKASEKKIRTNLENNEDVYVQMGNRRQCVWRVKKGRQCSEHSASPARPVKKQACAAAASSQDAASRLGFHRAPKPCHVRNARFRAPKYSAAFLGSTPAAAVIERAALGVRPKSIVDSLPANPLGGSPPSC